MRLPEQLLQDLRPVGGQAHVDGFERSTPSSSGGVHARHGTTPTPTTDRRRPNPMNITEAQAVAQILRFVTDLTLFERAGDDPDVDEARLSDDAGFLAGRVRQALGTGPDPDHVARRVEALLWLPEDTDRTVQDVPVAGGRL